MASPTARPLLIDIHSHVSVRLSARPGRTLQLTRTIARLAPHSYLPSYMDLMRKRTRYVCYVRT